MNFCPFKNRVLLYVCIVTLFIIKLKGRQQLLQHGIRNIIICIEEAFNIIYNN